jgi:hypothetical protein
MGHSDHDWVPLPIFVDGRILAAGAEQLSDGQETGAVLRWIEQAKITSVSSPADVAGLSPGALVEVTGRTCGNPMLALLDLVATSIPLVLDTAPTPARRAGGRTTADGPGTSKAPNQETSSVEEQRIMAGLITAARDGLRSGPVIDVVLLTEGGLAVVLPVDRSILGAAGEALLDDGEYRVVGKVSAVVGDDEGISLLRRSLLSATGPVAAREMLAELAGSATGIDIPDPVIDGPALQVIPIAILL